jgi:NADH:ubiquinone oxidoreductase subunit 3 (subunit A)
MVVILLVVVVAAAAAAAAEAIAARAIALATTKVEPYGCGVKTKPTQTRRFKSSNQP